MFSFAAGALVFLLAVVGMVLMSLVYLYPVPFVVAVVLYCGWKIVNRKKVR